MRLVFLGSFALVKKGTLSARALPLARELVKRGHDVTLLTTPWDAPAEAGKRSRDAGVRVVNLPLGPRGSAGLGAGMLRFALRERPDVVHAFKPIGPAGAAALLGRQLRRAGATSCRFVVDTDDWEGDGGWNERRPWPAPAKAILAWQERAALRAADAVTVASRALETIVWSLGVPPNRVHYLPNGATTEAAPSPPNPSTTPVQLFTDRLGWLPDPDERDSRSTGSERSPTARESLTAPKPPSVLEPSTGPEPPAIAQWPAVVQPSTIARPGIHSPRPSSPEPPTVLLYTRFVEFGIERVVAVWERVVARRPDARLLVVGAGFGDELQRLDRLLADRSLGATAHLAGWVEPSELRGYFTRAGVAIYPMDDHLINRTKCPAKLVELLAAGIPVVADAVGQILEYVAHPAAGRLVPSGDTTAMAVAVLELLEDPAQARRLGHSAAARIHADFGWPVLAERLEHFYQAILAH